MTEARNVFGEPLAECCTKPMTGFYRDGSCNTGPEDFGLHTVCTRVDAAFLAFSQAAGNDLSTPVPEFGFPGLKPGDCWCLCAERWKEAFDAGKAPKVRLTATHEASLEVVLLGGAETLRDRPELMKPANLLFILCDEHNPRVLGCAGHPMIRTPNLDCLTAKGVRFSDAYCNSPICVPSRASLATGRYVHRVRFWDNAIPFDGSVPSWHHRLREAGHEVTAIGKLHFRSAEDDNGFTREIMPLHIVDGIGDPLGWLRDPLPVRKAALRLANDAGCGNSNYQDYDDKITTAAVDWLKARASAPSGKPWVLFVSLVCPHFPLIARPRWYDLYPEAEVPLPALYNTAERAPDHPYIAAIRECQIYDKAFDAVKLRRALAAYFGLVSFVDDNVGKLIGALAATGLADHTRVLYSSDHGDNLGTRRLWGKSTMYEESAGVPMTLAGPEVPEGLVCHEPASLVDCFPTVIECVGAPPHPDDRDLPGGSLFDLARGTAPRRTILSEYHAAGAATGAFMIRKGPFKYVYYAGMPPQLFDLDTDPQERRDLTREPGYQGLVADCEAALRRVVDPDAADALAKADQRARIAAMGGREAIIARGSFGYSPTPGTTPVYN